jgi:proline racemase
VPAFSLFVKRYRTIDAHVAGEPVRLVVGGAPSVTGKTMTEKLAWLRRHGDGLRRCLMLEPRGHAGMHGAVLTEPVSPGAHAGILAMHSAGFPMLSGESVIAAVTIALEHKLIEGAFEELLLDTPVGLVRARPHYSGLPADSSAVATLDAKAEAQSAKAGASAASGVKIRSISLTGVPSFVYSAGLAVRLGTRTIPVDVAFGGEFYAIADSESIGIPIDAARASRLLQMGLDVKEATESSISVAHPIEKTWKGIHGTIFTAPPQAGADLRSATVLCGEPSRTSMDGVVLRRSPGVTGTWALMAVLDAMGLLADDRMFTHEGLMGTVLKGRVFDRKQPDEMPVVVPVIEGSAWITGHHEFVVEDGDDYLSSTIAT